MPRITHHFHRSSPSSLPLSLSMSLCRYVRLSLSIWYLYFQQLSNFLLVVRSVLLPSCPVQGRRQIMFWDDFAFVYVAEHTFTTCITLSLLIIVMKTERRTEDDDNKWWQSTGRLNVNCWWTKRTCLQGVTAQKPEMLLWWRHMVLRLKRK